MSDDERWRADRDLTNAALAKIARAQARGTLSPRMSISKHEKQIVLSDTTEKDRAWVAKTFGGESTRVHYWSKQGKDHLDRFDFRADLRDPTEKKHDWSYVPMTPRVEIWYTDAHECVEYVGYIDGHGKPQWRCRWCRKRMTVTAARALGLLPPR